MATTTKYSVELRNSAGELQQYLTPFVSDINWAWNRIGGCGNCNIKLAMEYRKITFNVMDDIQIRVATENKPTEQLSNGDFKLWTGGDAVAPDDWTLAGLGAVIAKESTIIKTGAHSVKLTRDGANIVLHQEIHTTRGIGYWKGKTVTLGGWVYATAANRARIYIHDSTLVTGTSSYHTGDSTWQYLTATLKISNAATYVRANVAIDDGDTVAYFDGASIIDKSTAPSSKLVYRGWVSNVKPMTSGQSGDSIALSIRGYFDLMQYIVVQDTGSEITYTSDKISVIVDSIIDTFVVANSDITKGTIDEAGFTADSLKFKTSVKSALATLADIEGGVEYGVDEDLVFFWRDEGTTVSHKFIVGNDAVSFKPQTIYDKLVNKIYFEGGLVTGAKYLRTATASTSITDYYLSEKIISNSAIVTQSVADQYLSALLGKFDTPITKFSINVPETSLRFEDTIPLGKISVYDSAHDAGAASSGIWGVISPDGGSGFVWGTIANGGSGKIWGGGTGTLQSQVDSIRYSLSQTEGKFNITLSTDNTDNLLAARMNQIEHTLQNVREQVA